MRFSKINRNRMSIILLLLLFLSFGCTISLAADDITVDFYVIVPDRTPPSDTIYITGVFNNWDPQSTPLRHVGENVWKTTITFGDYQKIQYRYTRGTNETAERALIGVDSDQTRTIQTTDVGGGKMAVVDYVTFWQDEASRDELVFTRPVNTAPFARVAQLPAGDKFPSKFVEGLPALVLRGPVKPIRNVILMIGDGYGISHRTLARIASGGPNAKLVTEQGLWEVGLANTHSLDSLATDSAAAGTQLATGYWTNNYMVGMLPDGTEVPTIAELAKELGKGTGLVVMSKLTHATPASFGAHAYDRNDELDIALDLFNNKFDVLLGGGRDQFIPKSAKGQRTDGRDLLKEFEAAGYVVVKNVTGMKNTNYKGDKIFGPLAAGHLGKAMNRTYKIKDLVDHAITRLDRYENGFFLMIEGSAIDWGGHDNDGYRVITESLDFEDTVEYVLNYAMKRDDTLVIVTADHESGGLTIVGGSASGTSAEVAWVHGDHTGTPVGVYSYGPNSYLFGGNMYLADIPCIIARMWGVTDFGPEREVVDLNTGVR